MIYLDYAAATPMTETAINVYTEVALNYYGNPISLHNTGTAAAEIVEASRHMLAQLIGGEKDGLYFTGGGSDANQLALESLIRGQEGKGRHLIASILEHSSIYNFFKEKEKVGYEVSWLPVDEFGKINPAAAEAAIRPDTILASIHYGNGEIGTIQDVEKLGEIFKGAGVIFHSDCAQSFGKLPIDLRKLSIDSITISSSKIGGPKGLGAVYIRPEIRWVPIVEGTTHEQGFRAGTLDVPGICAFAASAKETLNDMMEESNRLEQLRQEFIEGLANADFDVAVEGDPEGHLPHVLALRPRGMEGQYAMLEMNRCGIAVSTGSACLVGQSDPPRAMKALGLSDMQAKEFIRLSFGKQTTQQHIQTALNKLQQIQNLFAQRKEKTPVQG